MAKTYKLRKRLSEDTAYYDRDAIEKYIDFLEEKGRLLSVGNLLFDSEAMARPFVCNTQLCMRPDGRCRAGKRQSCCAAYAPRLSTRERERIDKILPGLLERFPNLAKRLEKAGGFYEWDEGYDRLVNKDPQGRCVFQTPDAKEFGFHACTLHAYCLETGLSRYEYEPSACIMFPLFLLDVDDDAGTILVSSHSREVMTMGESEDNYQEVGCSQPNKLARNPIYVEMQDTLVHMFGAEAWDRLDRAMRALEAKQ